MGREVRKVPQGWVHPKDERGHHIPLHEKFTYNESEIAEGLRDGWLKPIPPYYGVEVMPQWPDAERTHFMMYETTSEGTPMSPAFETAEELAHWLADNSANAGAGMTATYEQWLRVCNGGYAPTLIMRNGKMTSGVEGL